MGFLLAGLSSRDTSASKSLFVGGRPLSVPFLTSAKQPHPFQLPRVIMYWVNMMIWLQQVEYREWGSHNHSHSHNTATAKQHGHSHSHSQATWTFLNGDDYLGTPRYRYLGGDEDEGTDYDADSDDEFKNLYSEYSDNNNYNIGIGVGLQIVSLRNSVSHCLLTE